MAVMDQDFAGIVDVTGAAPATAAAATPLYRLEEASFVVAGRTILEKLTLDIPTGKVIGLIGHNGSGKSTLLKLLARQIAPTAGGIAFRGRAIAGWNGREFARAVAYLPQHNPAAAGMQVRELVALGRYPWHGALGRFGPRDRDKVAEAMALTDVTSLAEREVETLSGGERQRVWIAMLVAQDAGCLLLDEPISALDIAHQMEVLALVRRLCEERDIGVMVVLHDINMAARHCDDLIALERGRMIDRGRPEEVMTPERLQAIYGVSMAVLRNPESGDPIGVVR